jgi:hypothetical protein
LGQWLSHAEEHHAEHTGLIQAIVPLHTEIHALTTAMVRFKQLGQSDGLPGQMERFNSLCDQLLSKLAAMLN